ncbi:MAG: hypothetical protein IJF02_05640 [Oscillospiraceae bacterium]|nr:hypothetical protein [Oscillospiraceae bacterium]
MKKKALILVSVAAAALLLVWFFSAVFHLQDGQAREGRQQLEDALRRSCVACYAAEGIYPPSLSYLEQHYGVQNDKDRYTVFYEVFADNLMPEITVLEKES